MFPVSMHAIRHFVHEIPGHILVKINAGTEYLCDGCKTLGSGTRFQCNTCHFQLHEYCAMCPSNLPTFLHPQHQLTLATATAICNNRTCHVCGDDVEGLFYWCKDCEFNVHPACTQLPQSVRHAQHLDHPLMLQHSPPSWCASCREPCNSWRYRCGVCSFDLDLQCVLESPVQQPPYGGYGNWVATPHNMYIHVQPPQPYGGYAYHINGIPCPCGSSSQHQMCNHPAQAQAQAQGDGAATNGKGKRRKKMYSIIEQLAVGVASNVLFGFISN